MTRNGHVPQRLPGSDAAFHQLADDARQQRNGGRLIVDLLDLPVMPGQSPVAIADLLVQSLGLSKLGSGWRLVPEVEGRRIGRDILHADLAYHIELMPSSAAESLVERFLRFFPEPRAFLTNTTPTESGKAGSPITTATFDEGIVLVAGGRAGILWAADED
jgi:hypothetical protein